MGSQEYTGSFKCLELFVVDGPQTQVLKAAALYTVMDYIAQTVELVTFAEFLLGLAYCREHAKAES